MPIIRLDQCFVDAYRYRFDVCVCVCVSARANNNYDIVICDSLTTFRKS